MKLTAHPPLCGDVPASIWESVIEDADDEPGDGVRALPGAAEQELADGGPVAASAIGGRP
jgi:hypothetical protein